ncbi:hypothetical protein Poly51_03350 [Rubripirellula tenax]|uniref:AAA+ ATPase domain-containing protein n=1 Tax=Rubripirellula tenax TaxID=2528015 RepID=A0A5C6FEX8_9BACT|nr:AAA family ATPase [Rubripirellula tenax]TWU60061.1 hypothetical protein Poly51_03350 [Rubripirellula tenax]
MQTTTKPVNAYTVPPFPAFPAVTRYVALGSVEDALTRVSRSIDAQEAISLIIGPPGTGKSLICGLLVEQYKETHDVVVLGDTTIENRAAFLRHLLHHLGVNFFEAPENDLHLALVDRVCRANGPDGGLLIILDEAQALSAEVLESIRMVTNIMQKGKPRVSAVVCGAMKLDELLIDSSLEPFTQRVSTRCYLHPMNGHETRYFIEETIRGCGADPSDAITDEAIAAIHHAASGVPRLVNQMMTQAIDSAEEAGETMVTEQIVDLAWATLQQLPGPMLDEPSLKSSGGSSIEFGELDAAPVAAKKPNRSKAADDELLGFADEDSESEWDLEEPAIELENLADVDLGSHGQGGCGQSSNDAEIGSAMWMDESDEAFKSVSAAALPSALFGDFEIEEDVELDGSTKQVVAKKEIAKPEVAAKVAVAEVVAKAASEAVAAPRYNFEAMLHQEIVGMTTYDQTVTILPEPTAPQSKLAAAELAEAKMEEERLHLLRVEEDAEETQSEEAQSLRLNDDDSDLLVIEDEMELMRADSPKKSDASPRNVTIDFQSMLSRMRTGT